MIVFNGGLTIEQVKKLKDDISIIYDRIPYKEAYAHRKNTFDYVPEELRSAPIEKFKQYISDDCFLKQYIFFAKYLKATLEFCNNSCKKNYIMICDIEEDVLNQYVGVGNYDDYRIEYRLPRKFVTSKNIVDFLYFEPYDDQQMANFKKKYADLYEIPPEEDKKAKTLILEKNYNLMEIEFGNKFL